LLHLQRSSQNVVNHVRLLVQVDAEEAVLEGGLILKGVEERLLVAHEARELAAGKLMVFVERGPPFVEDGLDPLLFGGGRELARAGPNNVRHGLVGRCREQPSG